MAKDASGPGWAHLVGVGVGAVYLARVIQGFRRQAVDPDSPDPARHILLLIKWGCPALIVGVVAANMVAFNLAGMNALFPAIALDVVAALGLGALAIFLSDLAETRRRRTRYVICEADYVNAPRHIKSTMRRVYRSARSVRTSRAYQTGMFGDVELDRLVYSAAERAVLSSDLSAAVRDLTAASDAADRTLAEQAKEQLPEIRRYLQDVEAALARTATAAGRLSNSIPGPAPSPAAQQAAHNQAEAAAERHRQLRSRAADASARASSPTRVNANAVEDRVSAVYAGYQEATKISHDVLRGPAAPRPEHEATAKPSVPKAAWQAARSTAGKTTRFSVATAKVGAEKLRKRRSDEN